MFGSTEEFNKRQARWAGRYVESPDNTELRRRALLGRTGDHRIKALHEYVAEWNRDHPRHLHISVDHIRSYPRCADPSYFNSYENLRVMPLLDNISDGAYRSEEEIASITEEVARDRVLYPNKIVIYWGPKEIQGI